MSEDSNSKYIEKLKSINSTVTKTKDSVHAKIGTAKKRIVDSLENIERKTDDQLTNAAKRVNQLKEETSKKVSESMETFTNELQNTTTGLNEDMSSNISNMEEYGKQTLDDAEQKIALQLDTSLSNIKDSVNSHLEYVGNYDQRINELGTETINKTVDLVAERDATVNTELKQILEINGETLNESLESLKNDFQNQIGTKVEDVYKGVVQTKEVLDSIITDTLSHLKSNLHRLHNEIDAHFTQEVGELQNTILAFEEQMEKTVSEIVDAYNKQMTVLLEKHKEKTQNAIGEIRGEMNKIKENIMNELAGLNEEQRKRVQGSIEFMDGQISEARKEIIDSFATLRQELEKLGKENRTLVMQELNKFNEMTLALSKETLDANNAILNAGTNDIKKMMEESKEVVKGTIESTKKEVDGDFKEVEKSVNNMVTEIIKETKEV